MASVAAVVSAPRFEEKQGQLNFKERASVIRGGIRHSILVLLTRPDCRLRHPDYLFVSHQTGMLLRTVEEFAQQIRTIFEFLHVRWIHAQVQFLLRSSS